jgi:hypothetical protein
LGIKTKRNLGGFASSRLGVPFQRSKSLLQAASGLADAQLGSGKLLVITVTRPLIAVTFLESHAENVGDNNDQSGDRAATTAALNCVTSSQVIEFTRALADTMISRVTSKKSPHIRRTFLLS